MKKSRKISLQDALQFAVRVHQGGQPRQAIEHYRAILEVAPNHPDALHYLAIALHQTGKLEAALRLLERVLALAPDYVDARNNLGNMQKEAGRFAEAEQSYRAVLARRPDFPLAHNNLGVALKAQGRIEEALGAYRQAVAFAPDFVQGWINLGHACKKLERMHDCLDAYRQAIALSPASVDANRDLGRALVAFGRPGEALEAYRSWQQLEPDNPVVAHLIAACGGEAAPQRASDHFVQQTFDRFAGSFDQVLANLAYRAPELCAQMVASLLGAPGAKLDVLDAGCGTGLCGPLLRPWARQLHGIDLSPGMLAKAAERGGYDTLEAAELTVWLAAHPASCDLPVSADTLCYFGALDDVLAAAAAALRPGAALVLTVEASAGAAADSDFHLHPHGRYSHREAYLRRALAGAGLALARLEQVTLRQEAKRPVAGLLVGAVKPRAVEP